jgi:hypothetical protein
MLIAGAPLRFLWGGSMNGHLPAVAAAVSRHVRSCTRGQSKAERLPETNALDVISIGAEVFVKRSAAQQLPICDPKRRRATRGSTGPSRTAPVADRLLGTKSTLRRRAFQASSAWRMFHRHG